MVIHKGRNTDNTKWVNSFLLFLFQTLKELLLVPISKKTLKIKIRVFIKIISAWMFLHSQTLTYFSAKIQCPYVKWEPYALSWTRFSARGNVLKRYAISLARVLVRRIVKAKSRVLNENRQVPQLETRIFSSQVQICWIAEWLNASTLKCCWVFEIVNCWRGARAAEASLSVARGRIFFRTASPCLFAIVSIISLGSWITYFASYTEFWHVFYLYVVDDLHNLRIGMTTCSCHGERNLPPWHTTDREKSSEVSMDRYFILDSGLSFAFSLYNMSTLDERRAHKQEAGVKVHCYSLQMADKELLEWLEGGFL